MNNRNLKLSAVLIAVGIVGVTIGGLSSMPYAMETIARAEKAYQERVEDINKNLDEIGDFSKLSIQANLSNISIEQSDKPYSYVKSGTNPEGVSNIDMVYNESDKSISLIEKVERNTDNGFKFGMTVQEFTDKIIENDIITSSRGLNQITIYLTKPVDLDVQHPFGQLNIESTNLINDYIKGNIGGINITETSDKKLKKLELKSNDILLENSVLSSFEVVEVEGDFVEIQGYKNVYFEDIPSHLNIQARRVALKGNSNIARNINLNVDGVVDITDDFEGKNIVIKTNIVKQFYNEFISEYDYNKSKTSAQPNTVEAIRVDHAGKIDAFTGDTSSSEIVNITINNPVREFNLYKLNYYDN